MQPRPSLPTLSILAALLAPPALAQQEPTSEYLCGEDRFMDQSMLESLLTGRWEAHLGAGYAIAGPTVIAHPADPDAHFGTLDKQEDGLVLIPEEGGVVLDLDWVTDQTWRFDREPSLPEGVQVANGTDLPILPFSSDEVGDLVGCDINELPRLVGTGAAVIDGVTMEFTYRLMLVSYKELAGFQEVRATAHGIPVFERRPVMMILQFDSD